MRSRTPLVLMEQLMMVLVFALAAALCLQCFALAHRLSGEDAARDRAIAVVQNAAEVLKACGSDCSAAAQQLYGVGDQDNGCVCYDADWKVTDPGADAVYRLELERLPQVQEGLGQAEVRVVKIGDASDVLFSVTAAWQEAAYE